MAQDTLWIVVTSLLWAFEVQRAADESGRGVDVPGEYTFGVVWCDLQSFSALANSTMLTWNHA